MRHQVAGTKLGRTSAHRKAMLRNMVTSLILRDRVETTLPKAKEMRRLADKMITLAKNGSLDARRRALEVVRNRDAVQKLFTTLVDRYRERQGGYTRIIKLGFRHGDSAPMAVLEYLTAEIKGAHKKDESKVTKKAVVAKAKPKKAVKKEASATAHPAKEAKASTHSKPEKKSKPKKTKKEDKEAKK